MIRDDGAPAVRLQARRFLPLLDDLMQAPVGVGCFASPASRTVHHLLNHGIQLGCLAFSVETAEGE